MTRQRRDPATKAQEALDIAKRRVDKLRAKQKACNKELRDIEAELSVAERDAGYLASSPYLKPAGNGKAATAKEPTA